MTRSRSGRLGCCVSHGGWVGSWMGSCRGQVGSWVLGAVTGTQSSQLVGQVKV